VNEESRKQSALGCLPKCFELFVLEGNGAKTRDLAKDVRHHEGQQDQQYAQVAR
jgi:metal-responsive CopG/Arc/MetJ family transcriptional regulator